LKGPDPKDVRSILVLLFGAFGDTMLATPTLRTLKRAYPGARLAVVMEPALASLLEGLPYVDEVIVFGREAARKKGPLRAFAEMAAFGAKLRPRRFDLLLDFDWESPMAFATGAAHRLGFASWAHSWAYTRAHRPKVWKYMGDYMADLLRLLGLEPDSLALDFWVGPEADAEMAAWMGRAGLLGGPKPLAVTVGASWDLKRYPVGQTAAAIRLALGEGPRRALLLWGPGEEDRAGELAGLIGPRALLAPATSFRQMGALLQRSACLLANDTGTKHLAVAVGCPSVTVYGPTRPVVWSPPGDPMHVALRLDLECMAGCRAFECRPRTHACMADMAPAEVARALAQFFETAA
jgi:ADP-heptose:LPS heptosyltransferase